MHDTTCKVKAKSQLMLMQQTVISYGSSLNRSNHIKKEDDF
jgi:hypothetical protein